MAKKVIIPVEVLGTDTEEVEVLSSGTALVAVITDRPIFIDLIKFTKKEESIEIIKLKRVEYDKITIAGVEDTANYKVVTANMGQMRDDRRAFENAAYANVIDPIKLALKDYAADIDAVVEEFKAGEQAERNKKDFIDSEKKRIKAEAEEAKQKAALLRVNEITTLGGVFNGNVYLFPYDDSLLINSLQLKDFDEDEFQEFLSEVKESYASEQERVAEEARLAAQKKIDDAAEAERVKAQALVNETATKELSEKRTKLRIKELNLYGFVSDGHIYSHPKCNSILLINIECDNDDLWDAFIELVEVDINRVPEPIVEDVPVSLPKESSPFVGGSSSSFTIRPAPAEEVEVEDVIDIDHLFEDEPAVDITLSFSALTPYTDLLLSGENGKHFVRIYPDDFADVVVSLSQSAQKVINTGKLQSLNWMVLQK